MQYVVIKPFRDITGFKRVGDPIELDNHRAAKLRRMGLIGGRYQPSIQTATIKPAETRATKEAPQKPEPKPKPKSKPKPKKKK